MCACVTQAEMERQRYKNKYAMIIDGKALSFALSKSLNQLFLKVRVCVRVCSCVCVCVCLSELSKSHNQPRYNQLFLKVKAGWVCVCVLLRAAVCVATSGS